MIGGCVLWRSLSSTIPLGGGGRAASHGFVHEPASEGRRAGCVLVVGYTSSSPCEQLELGPGGSECAWVVAPMRRDVQYAALMEAIQPPARRERNNQEGRAHCEASKDHLKRSMSSSVPPKKRLSAIHQNCGSTGGDRPSRSSCPYPRPLSQRYRVLVCLNPPELLSEQTV